MHIEKSRNFTVGYRLGRGESLETITETLGSVAEGVQTTKAAHALSQKLGVECPITATAHSVLFEGRDIREAVASLMSREPKPSEFHGINQF
jgi:glycerol-3-phosphate dehydrogenase (NAD(P)+)